MLPPLPALMIVVAEVLSMAKRSPPAPVLRYSAAIPL
jgi:hypothetical protein